MSDDDRMNDLRWRAFCYVAGELSADEARALEEQMADDQQAREAVSWAVGLGLKVAAARPAIVSPATPVSRGKVSLVAVGGWIAAAASVMLLVWSFSSRPRETAMPERSIASSALQDTSIDAAVWLELQRMSDPTTQSERDFEESAASESWEATTDHGPGLPAWVTGLAGDKKGAANDE